MPIRKLCLMMAVALGLTLAAEARAMQVADAPVRDTLRWSATTAPPADTLRFEPTDERDDTHRMRRAGGAEADQWLQAPFGDELLTDLSRWRARGRRWRDDDLLADYNRVDMLRLGYQAEYGPLAGRAPRIGARIEYAFDRERVLYGFQLEQPLVSSGRYALGATMGRRTDHNPLQQMEDEENSLAMLFGRQDYRDYFEREGAGVYAKWRVPDFSTITVHLREDEYRSLGLDRGVRSWFHADRPLRLNPAIDEGRGRTLTLRLERLLHRAALRRAGTYHWLELERAGGRLGGDFTYTRALMDLRSVLRLSPATTLSLRTLAGSTLDGRLPRQQEFTLGGVDGLRGHRFDEFRGDQIALAQAEYTVGMWHFANELFEGGLHAIVFIDSGRAWSNPAGSWDANRQRMQADGGFGFSTSEDNVRVYLARNLQTSGSKFVTTLRLQRPF